VSESNLRLADLPAPYLKYNGDDPAWLAALPALIERLARQWAIEIGPHFSNLQINYVASAALADGTPCVFKLSQFVDETLNEIAALRLWNGRGAARLLAAEPDVGALLVERLEPGTMLVEVADSDDDAATRIAAGLLRELWQPATPGHGLRPLESWCDAYDRNREALSRGASGFPSELYRRADALRADLLVSTDRQMALHGDMHHYNVLCAQRAPWLAIDPKGLVGDRCFDVCQFFRNPRDVPPEVNRRRLDIFCGELGLDRARVKSWCFVHAMLDACWCYEDGESWQRSVAYAEATQSF
jgi:streptomycin 6-kinase